MPVYTNNASIQERIAPVVPYGNRYTYTSVNDGHSSEWHQSDWLAGRYLHFCERGPARGRSRTIVGRDSGQNAGQIRCRCITVRVPPFQYISAMMRGSFRCDARMLVECVVRIVVPECWIVPHFVLLSTRVSCIYVCRNSLIIDRHSLNQSDTNITEM